MMPAEQVISKASFNFLALPGWLFLDRDIINS